MAHSCLHSLLPKSQCPPLAIAKARGKDPQEAALFLLARASRTSREPARTSVSSSRTFVPLLTTEGLRILLSKSSQRERTCLMKLGIFILLLVNHRPGGVSYVTGVEKSATPLDGGI